MDVYKEYKNYSGDVNLEYGGLFVNLDDWKYEYSNCLRVTDLDSGCGFDGAVMVEHITVFGWDDKTQVENAKACYGWDKIPGNTSDSRKLAIIESMQAYGYYDTVNDFMGEHRWIIQTDSDYAMEFDGWKADHLLPDNLSLLEFIEQQGWLSEFE